MDGQVWWLHISRKLNWRRVSCRCEDAEPAAWSLSVFAITSRPAYVTIGHQHLQLKRCLLLAFHDQEGMFTIVSCHSMLLLADDLEFIRWLRIAVLILLRTWFGPNWAVCDGHFKKVWGSWPNGGHRKLAEWWKELRQNVGEISCPLPGRVAVKAKQRVYHLIIFSVKDQPVLHTISIFRVSQWHFICPLWASKHLKKRF